MIKNAYTVEKKLIVLKLVTQYGIKEASRLCKIHLSIIYRWRNDITRLENVKNKGKVRRIGAGRVPSLTQEIESKLFNWIRDRNDKDLVVNYSLVRDHCVSNYSHTGLRFSTGWFACFKKRLGLSLRRVTSYSHRPRNLEQDEMQLRINQFRSEIASLDPSIVLVNMDETPVWFDNPSRYNDAN